MCEIEVFNLEISAVFIFNTNFVQKDEIKVFNFLVRCVCPIVAG